MIRIISIANPKGGVGKTTTAINLAASLAIAEKKVLLIDLDPNGSLTAGLGFSEPQRLKGMYEIFARTAELYQATVPYPHLPLDVVPCAIRSAEQENRVMQLASYRSILKRKLDDAKLKGRLDYDYILIDTPPSLNNLTLAALSASTSVLVPLQCGYFALEVVERLLKMVLRLRTSINPGLEVEGILLNFYDRSTREAQRAAREARKIFRSQVMHTVIPKNAALGYAAFRRKPAVLVEATSPGATSYLALAREILHRRRPFDISLPAAADFRGMPGRHVSLS